MARNLEPSFIGDTPEQRIKHRATDLGFDLVGIASAEPSHDRNALLAWLDAGFHADMAYMSGKTEHRLDPAMHLDGARSVIMTGVSCNVALGPPEPGVARFARYALNEDYHEWIMTRLRRLAHDLPDILSRPCRTRPFCDTSAVLERELGRRAGLGWIGKNAMLINPRYGSHILLGGIFLDIQLSTDTEIRNHCGTCRRCLDACPTQAIVAPRVLDARQCIAYHTIESRSAIPDRIAAAMGTWVFGCDICQEVCPFNNVRTPETRHDAYRPRAQVIGRPLAALASLTDDEFRREFRRSPVKRAKPHGLRRNAVAALVGKGEDPSGPSPGQDG